MSNPDGQGDVADARPTISTYQTQTILPSQGANGTAQSYLDTTDADYIYNMNHRYRGKALIINNQDFQPSTGMGSRTGSDIDRDNLKKTFQYLGFEVECKNNLAWRDMARALQKAASEDHSNNDCFVCAILSHGEKDFVYGTDGPVEFETLYGPFKGDACRSLVGKPKLFFLQACRGDKLDNGTMMTDAEPFKADAKRQFRIASESDFLIAYSVVPGYYSWRNCRNGSWFVQALCDVLQRDGKRLELLQILTRVNRMVSYTFESNAAQPHMTMKKQSPCITSMLTKEVYFHDKY